MDHGHELTELQIKKIEERLQREYTQAAQDIQYKLDDYFQRFQWKDEKWRQWVYDGEKTAEEYRAWRESQMASGARWRALRDSISEDLKHTNEMAQQIINGEMPEIFATNANWSIYQIEHDAHIDTGLNLYSRETVYGIVRDDPDLLLPPGQRVARDIAEGRAARWHRQKIQNAMIQGILQGESIPNLAKRLAENVADSDYKAAIRNARTMATNAQNAGRYDAYRRVEGRGVQITLEWAATLDNRTRHEHRMMHGQRRKVNEPFEVDVPRHGTVKILYPAQTNGDYKIPPECIWNCRCTILAYVKGFEEDTITTSDKMDMPYEEWLKAKAKPEPIKKQKEKGDAIRQKYINEYRKG